MIDLDQDLYDRLMLLLGGSENKDDTLNSLGPEMAWEVMTRLECFLRAKLTKKTMAVGEEPTWGCGGKGGWAVVFQSEKAEPTCTESVYVVRVDEYPGTAPAEVTRSSTGEKKRLHCVCVQQYREQARVLRRELIAKRKMRAACSFAEQHEDSSW